MKILAGRALCLCLLLSLAVGCAKGRRVPVGSEPELKAGATTVSSYDVRTAAQKFTQGLLEKLPQIHEGQRVPTIAVLPLKNQTSSYLDTELITDQMRQDMMKEAGGKIAFLDREATEAIVQERKAKRAGVIGGTVDKPLLGSDYFLRGAVRGIDKQVGDERFTYTQISVRLTDAESRQIVWEERYEVKKAGRAGFYDR